MRRASNCTPPFPEKGALAKVQSAWKYRSEAPQVFNGAELERTRLPELEWVVPDVLPAGLALLAGAPKAGKSWLALQLAYSVAIGCNVLDDSECEMGRALYLALEDNQRRLQVRQTKIAGAHVERTGPTTFKIDRKHPVPRLLDYSLTYPTPDEGGLDHLREYLQQHWDVRLVIIDILERFTPREGKDVVQRSSTRCSSRLHDLSKDFPSVAPSLSCITPRRRKPPRILTASAGRGVSSGVVDTVLVLERQESEEGVEAILSVQGRDAGRRSLLLRPRVGRDGEDDGPWESFGDAPPRSGLSEPPARHPQCAGGQRRVHDRVSGLRLVGPRWQCPRKRP